MFEHFVAQQSQVKEILLFETIPVIMQHRSAFIVSTLIWIVCFYRQ